jgi:DNA repair protein SbcD/Mre11
VLRLLHTADIHLGARHADLGEAAAAQRERQFAAFRAAIDLAISEKVDLFLIAGDLFDSNTQPRRSVERVAAELARLRDAKIRAVVIPGTHDVYDRASIYRAYDLPALAGSKPNDDWLTVLTPDQPDVHLRACDAVVFGRLFETKRSPRSPLADFDAAADERGTWRIGMVHGALSIPGRTDRDDVTFTRDEIMASGLDYLALGHWHSAQRDTAGATTYAYSGAPEPVAVDQDRAGKVLLVTLEERSGKKTVKVEERQVGKTRFATLDIATSEIANQPALIQRLRKKADPDLVLDARLTGVRPDELDVDPTEVETELKSAFLRLRMRDQSVPALTTGTLPSRDTIAGAFIRDLEAQIAELEASGHEGGDAAEGEAGAAAERAAELRDALRLGRLLLDGHEVTL